VRRDGRSFFVFGIFVTEVLGELPPWPWHTLVRLLGPFWPSSGCEKGAGGDANGSCLDVDTSWLRGKQARTGALKAGRSAENSMGRRSGGSVVLSARKRRLLLALCGGYLVNGREVGERSWLDFRSCLFRSANGRNWRGRQYELSPLAVVTKLRIQICL
jgi:hypothetical protein